MSNRIQIRKAAGSWVIRAKGAVIGETSHAIELSEANYPAVIYFPRSDVAMAFLEKTEKTTHCPFKGDASYYTIVAKSGRIENIAWSYETPNDDVAQIKDYLAFYTGEDVAVEQV